MYILHMLKKKLPTNFYFKKWFIVSVSLIVFGSLFAFTKPVILKAVIRFLCVAKPGHYIRMKHESKQKFTYKIFIWNVTNPNEISAGTEKPKMQQVGPYVFLQRKQKINSTDNETEDTVSFNFVNTFHLSPQLSAPLTGDEMVTVLNVGLVVAIVNTKKESPHMMDTVIESMNIIFENPSSIFLTASAKELMNNGIDVNCNHTAYVTKLICGVMRKHKMLRTVNGDKNHLRLRWFDLKNNSVSALHTIQRGSKNIYDVGRVTAIDGEPKLKYYKENDQCNVINGTDKMFFAPFQEKEDILWVYSDEGCKSLPLRFKRYKRVLYVKSAYKSVNLSDPLMDPSCECNKYTGCAVQGTNDLYACYNAFMIGSAPHFYSADPKIRETMEGLEPKEELHETGVYFDLLTSGPLLAYERYQINCLVTNIPEYHLLRSIANDIYIPLLWYEEKFRIPNYDLALILASIISKITGVVAGYIILTIGIIMFIAVSGLRIHKYITEKFEIPSKPFSFVLPFKKDSHKISSKQQSGEDLPMPQPAWSEAKT